VTGDMIRKLVDIELRDINRSDIAAFLDIVLTNRNRACKTQVKKQEE
jgi:hypothetical protein